MLTKVIHGSATNQVAGLMSPEDKQLLTTIGNTYVSTSALNSLLGANSGVATLDASGKIPSSQLPSYVDDVIEAAQISAFPVTGESGKIYVALDTNKTYRWSGSAYVEISESLALGEASSTAYRGDRGKVAYDHAAAKGSAFTSGLYKITTNAEGHVTAATAVVKADITGLGISGDEHTHNYAGSASAGGPANSALKASTVIDSGNNNKEITLAYSKAGLAYDNMTWLAAWNGYELRAINKNLFTPADTCIPLNTKGGIGECAGGGKYTYATIATINTNVSYVNGPMVLELSGRYIPFTTIQIRFANQEAVDPNLSTFISNYSNAFFIKKTNTSEWTIYCNTGGVWGSMVLHRITGAYSDRITPVMTQTLTALPADCTQVTYAGNVGYALQATADVDGNAINSTYLKLSGGTLTGALTIAGSNIQLGTSSASSNDSGDIVWLYGNGNEKMRLHSSNNPTEKIGPAFRMFNASGQSLYSGNLPLADGTSATGTWNISITGTAAKATADADGNTISNTYLKLSGGTLTGAINTANNTWNKIGDDIQIGDINDAGTLGIQGLNGNTSIRFTTYNQTTKTAGGKITWDGSVFTIPNTLVLSNTTDAKGTENVSPALIVGGTATTAHIQMDCNEIIAKSNGTTATDLYLNADGAPVHFCGTGSATTDYAEVRSAADASSISTGALRVVGGVGIAKKLYVGSNTYLNALLTVVTGGIWVQGGSAAGNDNTRMSLTAGMPDQLPYNTSKRGAFIYSNAIALCDPLNGNNNNDAGWVRQIETTKNTGELELGVGDDGSEIIVARQYNTSSAVAAEITLLNASHQSVFRTILPVATTTYDLGSSSVQWSNVYATTFHGALNGNAASASKLSNTSAIGSDVKPVYFTNGGVPQATATEMIRGFTNSNYTDLNVCYDSGFYSLPGGAVTNYPSNGDKYAAMLVVAYRKPSGNTKVDYAWQMGACTQDNDRLWYRIGKSTTWRAWRQFVHIAANTAVGNSTAPVYVDANGTVQACTAYSSASVNYATSSNTSAYLTIPRVSQSSKTLPGKNLGILQEYSNQSADLPSTHWYYILSTQGDDVNYGAQLALGMTTTAIYYRVYNSKTWSAWQSLINTDSKVYQSSTTTANWRKLTFGEQNTATMGAAITTHTTQLYTAVNIEAQPSTGTLAATVFRVGQHVDIKYNSTDQSLDFIFV